MSFYLSLLVLIGTKCKFLGWYTTSNVQEGFGKCCTARSPYVRGRNYLSYDTLYNSVTPWCRPTFYASYKSYVCPLSSGVWWLYVLQEVAEWETKMWRDTGWPRHTKKACWNWVICTRLKPYLPTRKFEKFCILR